MNEFKIISRTKHKVIEILGHEIFETTQVWESGEKNNRVIQSHTEYFARGVESCKRSYKMRDLLTVMKYVLGQDLKGETGCRNLRQVESKRHKVNKRITTVREKMVKLQKQMDLLEKDLGWVIPINNEEVSDK